MANFFTSKIYIYIYIYHITVIYKDFRDVTPKLQRIIGFIKKALYNEIIPEFAQVNGISLIKMININLKEAHFVLI